MNLTHRARNIGIVEQIGQYSDAVEVAPNVRLLMTSGTLGLPKSGTIPDTVRLRYSGTRDRRLCCWSFQNWSGPRFSSNLKSLPQSRSRRPEIVTGTVELPRTFRLLKFCATFLQVWLRERHPSTVTMAPMHSSAEDERTDQGSVSSPSMRRKGKNLTSVAAGAAALACNSLSHHVCGRSIVVESSSLHPQLGSRVGDTVRNIPPVGLRP